MNTHKHYEDYLLIFRRPSGRIGSRPFDWCDFDILYESGHEEEDVKRTIKEFGIFTGRWIDSPVAVIRTSDKDNPKLRQSAKAALLR
jgi:hypothetical protein